MASISGLGAIQLRRRRFASICHSRMLVPGLIRSSSEVTLQSYTGLTMASSTTSRILGRFCSSGSGCFDQEGGLSFSVPMSRFIASNKTAQGYNQHHKVPDFSLAKVKNILGDIGGTRIIHENPLIDHYSWELVAEKL